MYQPNLFVLLFFRQTDDLQVQEAKLMKKLEKYSKSMGKCGVEQTATLRAWSAKNNLPVDDYRTQVEKELEESNN